MRKVILQEFVTLDALVADASVLGSGRPLFDGKLPTVGMKLQSAQPTDLGAVSLRYTHASGRGPR